MTSLLIVSTLAIQAQTTWTGATDSNWGTPTNWSAGVPDAADDVTIPNTTNKPTIGAGTAAVAKTIEVQTGTTLTIAAMASLTVNGSKSVPSGGTTALLNDGTVQNNGQLILGNLSAIGGEGLYNRGTFNNNSGGDIKIDRSTYRAILNRDATFNNSGLITIGASASVGERGLNNFGATAMFNNNTGGEIKIDNATNVGLYNESGTFTNVAKITIGTTTSVGSEGIANAGTFNNNTGGDIKIDRSTSRAILNINATFNNSALITIGSLASVGQRGLNNFGATSQFNNNTGGEIKIDNATEIGLFNESGTFINTAKITIGATTSVGARGVDNKGTFSNNTGGEIKIDNATNVGLFNESGTFTNAAKITIGATTSVGNEGIANAGTFNNNTGGDIKIDRSTFRAIWNINATFNNSALITIGSLASVGQRGLNNFGATSQFNNNTGGEIKIDNATNVGLYNESGTFTNAAKITIGATTSIGGEGIDNRGTFNNNTGGEIKIDNATSRGLLNWGTFTNVAKITIGATASIGREGLLNGNTFNNNMGGDIKIDRTNDGLFNQSTFSNSGLITIGASASVGSLGLINFTSTAAFNNNTGGEIKIARSTNHALYNNATFNNASLITIGAMAIVNENGLTNQDGTFNNNTGGEIKIDNVTARGLWNLGGTFTNGAKITIGATASIGNSGIENNATFNNNTGGNIKIDRTGGSQAFYTSGIVNNEATIEIGSNAAVTGTGLTIVAGTGVFNNKTGGLLTINRSTGFALENLGILDNSSTIKIGNITSVANRGIVHRNGGTLNNKTGGLIQIDRTLAVEAFFTSGVVNNEATIEIGSIEAVTGTGLTIVAGTGVFNNKTGGLLTINRSTGFALENLGILDNSSTIKIGNITSVANRGIVHRNGGTLNNKPSGSIQIDRTSVAEAFYTTGLVNNEGSIQIGGNAAVTGRGITIEGNIFNNKTGGDIRMNLIAEGISNNGTFANDALITIDNDTRKAQNGIYNGPSGSFTNSATGIISIKKALFNGIWNNFGNFTNAGKITIRDIFNTFSKNYSTGILSYGPFSSLVGSEIYLDQVESGIVSTNAFTNAGLIRMGENAPLTGSGIINVGGAAAVFNNNTGGDISIKQTAVDGVRNDVSSTFNNNACAKLTIFDNANNAGTMTNGGLLTVNTLEAHTNTGTLTNNGIIEYPQGNPIPKVTNNDVIIAPITVCNNNSATPALTIGGANSFNIGTTWYKEPALTNVAGTYSPNTFTAMNLTASSTYPLYFEITDPTNMCTRTVSINVVNSKPTITLTTNTQTLNEGDSQTLCDTDANPVNNLQFAVTTNCVAGNAVWRVQAGDGVWSDWSATPPLTQLSNNQPHRYQAACNAACEITYSGVISLTINYRATTPLNVSLVADGTTVAAGEEKSICDQAGNSLNFNATCATGERLIYSVDGGVYLPEVPAQIVDGQFHNYRVRCQKSDGTVSCVETESGVMRLKISTINITPVASLSANNGCGTQTSFSGTANCGSLTTVWYNATTNVALPNLPNTTPNETTSYYARCQGELGCQSGVSNTVTFTVVPVNDPPVISSSAEIVCTGVSVTVSANCPAGSTAFWNTGVSTNTFQVSFNNVTRQTYWARCVFANGCQSPESIRKDILWKAFDLTFINIGQSQSAIKPANDRNLWSSQFITADGGPVLENSTEANPTIYHSENLNKTAPRFWTIQVETCALGSSGSVTYDMLAKPESGVVRSYNTHENNAPYFMYANRDGYTELYAQNHPAYGFYLDNGAGGNVYDAGLPKGLYKLGIRYWDQKGQGSIYPSTRQPAGTVLAYQEYWFRIQSKDGVGVGAARLASDNNLSSRRDLNPLTFAEVVPNPVSNVLRLKVTEAKAQKVNVSLIDASGRTLLQRGFVPETNQHQEEFEVSEIANGMYFLKVNAGDKQATLKVVKVQ